MESLNITTWKGIGIGEWVREGGFDFCKIDTIYILLQFSI